MSRMASTAIEQISYQDLYERWERGNWRATELDFSEDRDHWHHRFSDFERRAALWNYSMFLHGEDSVAENLSPYIDAAPHEEQKYFLATQQVDEARHAVFFGRFMREVVDAGDDIASSLEATRPELTWGFRKTFARLDRMANELRRDRSLPNLAAAITLYHVIVEATLAQTGQHFIESYLIDRDVMPAFRSGMENVSLDEQRHIGFGVKMLSDLQQEDPECRYAVAELLREVIPWAMCVFIPPNWDRNYIETFGPTVEEVFAAGMRSFEAKMRTAGLPVDELPGPAPYPVDLPVDERVDLAIALMQAGVLGEKNGPPSREPEVVAMLFETMRGTMDAGAVPARPTTLQWDFRDHEPWFLSMDNGSSRVEQGRVEDPDLTFRCRWEDWVDVAMRREDPRMAVAKGKLRLRGSPLTLWRTRNLFPR